MPMEWDDAAFKGALTRSAIDIGINASAKAAKFSEAIVIKAKMKCPVGSGEGSGKLRDSIGATPGINPIGPFWDVGTRSDVGIFQEFGTGVYGPKKTRIVPKNAKVLHFEINGKEVFAKSVKGSPPQPFMRPSIIEAVAALRTGAI